MSVRLISSQNYILPVRRIFTTALLRGSIIEKYPSTLANSTLIILFSEMLKFSKIISSKSNNIVKENLEYSRIFHLLK